MCILWTVKNQSSFKIENFYCTKDWKFSFILYQDETREDFSGFVFLDSNCEYRQRSLGRMEKLQEHEMKEEDQTTDVKFYRCWFNQFELLHS